MTIEGDTDYPLIIRLDQHIFHWINGKATFSWGDAIFPLLRTPSTWIPLYALIILFAIWKQRLASYRWIAAMILLVIMTDQAGNAIKYLFMRVRPCSDDTLPFACRLLLDYRPSGYSFVSSHACNHFGFAFFLTRSFGRYTNPRILAAVCYVWAASIAYAQVYVGAHYPLDVICGAILGTGLAYAHSKFLHAWIWFGENPFSCKKSSSI